MKKSFFLIVLMWVLSAPALRAQYVAWGERAPKYKIPTWLDDHLPSAGERTYLEFFSAANPDCQHSLDRLQILTRQSSKKLCVVVITKDRAEVASPLLRGYLSEQIGVALDSQARVFTLYGVNYVPFGVLLDERNRVLWMGNSLELTDEIIDSKL